MLLLTYFDLKPLLSYVSVGYIVHIKTSTIADAWAEISTFAT